EPREIGSRPRLLRHRPVPEMRAARRLLATPRRSLEEEALTQGRKGARVFFLAPLRLCVESCGSIACIVVNPKLARLLRRPEERECVKQRHIIGIRVVAKHILISDEEEDGVYRIIAKAPAVRVRCSGVIASTRASVGQVEIEAQDITAGKNDTLNDVYVLGIGAQSRQQRSDVIREITS